MTDQQTAVHEEDSSASAAFLDRYAPPPGVYDEMCSAPGVVRPAWATLAECLRYIGSDEILRRWDQARAFLRESGVTFSIGNDPRGIERPWDVDPLPHLISADDWRVLEPALIQRATLLNQVLADLYGQQRLLREGHLPAELVVGQQAFLRPIHGMKVPRGIWLHLFAMDVARGADGSWRILGDRTQTPTGTGYALENRVTLLRLFPDAYHECRARRLIPFFEGLRETLVSLAPEYRDNARIVLLTPGPQHETYFEHVFLARHLGVSLVEGSDLTTRENRVYIKTLGGLQPVDVVLRRVEDHDCDPLELRYDSLLGVPGLVQAAHSGNVAIANALGTGLMSTPAMLAYLGPLCRALLGENLLLPSVETKWCGVRSGFDCALGGLDRMVLKATESGQRLEGFDCASLSSEQRAQLADRIRANPGRFVVQERLDLSTTPVWADGTLLPRPVVVRFYVVATRDGYKVMPGGLALTSSAWNTNLVTLESANASKDTWVVSGEPVNAPSLLQAMAAPMPLARSGMDMPSRVADNLFWLGRYVERADSRVRLMRSLFGRLVDETRMEEDPEVGALLRYLASQNCVAPSAIKDFEQSHSEAVEREAILAVTDPERPGTLHDLIRSLRRTLWLVRDRLSLDAWRFLSTLDRRMPSAEGGADLDSAAALVLLDDMLMPLAAFGGLVGDNTTRGPGWRFLDMGRRLERAHFVAGMLRGTICQVDRREAKVMQVLLEVADSGMTYRSRYLSQLQLPPVLDLLITDETNPRSVVHQLVHLDAHVESLLSGSARAQLEPEQRLVTTLLSRVRLAEVRELARPSATGVRRQLAGLLDELDRSLPELSNVLTRRYFSHSEPPRQRDSFGA